MTIDVLQFICEQLPGVTQDIKWENHLCFNTGDKMFLITNPDAVPCSASFKVPEDSFDQLCCREGFKPAAYLARYHWVYVDDINRLNRKEWEGHIATSYQLVFDKLPARKKQHIMGK